jgi:hypothetical protein
MWQIGNFALAHVSCLGSIEDKTLGNPEVMNKLKKVYAQYKELNAQETKAHFEEVKRDNRGQVCPF